MDAGDVGDAGNGVAGEEDFEFGLEGGGVSVGSGEAKGSHLCVHFVRKCSWRKWNNGGGD